jgi:hypothetical protein
MYIIAHSLRYYCLLFNQKKYLKKVKKRRALHIKTRYTSRLETNEPIQILNQEFLHD